MKKIYCTDEKDFSLETVKNRQNDRVYGPSKEADIAPDRLYHESSRFSKKSWSLPLSLGREQQTSTILGLGGFGKIDLGSVWHINIAFAV